MATIATATSRLYQAVREAVQEFVPRKLRDFWLAVPPVPASRPRVSRWGTYYAKGYEAFRKASKAYVQKHCPAMPTDKPLVVLLELIIPRPKTSERDYPRGDVDNYSKGPLDTITPKTDELVRIWHDDDQIVFLVAAKRFAESDDEVGVMVEWAEII